MESTPIFIHEKGLKENLLPYLSEEKNNKILAGKIDELAKLSNSPFTEVAPKDIKVRRIVSPGEFELIKVPRQDQLPLFQKVLSRMPSDKKKLMKSELPFEKAYFMYLNGLQNSWRFSTRLHSSFKNSGFKVVGNHK